MPKMLKKEIKNIINTSKQYGWIMEPEAKRLLGLADVDIPRFIWTKKWEEAKNFAETIGFPVAAKIVSSEIIHKSDVDGVAIGIKDHEQLKGIYNKFKKLKGFEGILVEEMLSGIELIIGATIDYQFGPIILLGMGGIEVEIYHDIQLRMAPLEDKDVISMVNDLSAHKLLEGYRGSEPINLKALTHLMINFSKLVMDIEDHIESIDLNPVICSSKKCIVADARIMLKK